MRKIAVACLILLTGCFANPVQKSVVILLDATTLTSMGDSYVIWYGIAEDGRPATGVIPKKVDLRLGDVVVVKKRPTDNTWTFVKRISHNR